MQDVPLQGERLQNGRSRENRSEIVTDSFLSQVRHGELERELKPWTPDKDDPNEQGLESTFQNTWNRLEFMIFLFNETYCNISEIDIIDTMLLILVEIGINSRSINLCLVLRAHSMRTYTPLNLKGVLK